MTENIREIKLRQNHDWNGSLIRNLDLSRQSFIVLVERKGEMLIPNGDLELAEGDRILVYSKESNAKYLREPLF